MGGDDGGIGEDGLGHSAEADVLGFQHAGLRVELLETLTYIEVGSLKRLSALLAVDLLLDDHVVRVAQTLALVR